MPPECVCGTPCKWHCPECNTPLCPRCAYGHRVGHGAPDIFPPADEAEVIRPRRRPASSKLNPALWAIPLALVMLFGVGAVVGNIRSTVRDQQRWEDERQRRELDKLQRAVQEELDWIKAGGRPTY